MMKKYTTIYYQHKKALTFERVDFQGEATEAEVKILAAVFKPKGHRLHKVVITTVLERGNEEA